MKNKMFAKLSDSFVQFHCGVFRIDQTDSKLIKESADET